MKKGVIIDIKDQYTYVLCKNAKTKKIKRQYYHEVGQEIELPLIISTRMITTLVMCCLLIVAFVFNPLQTVSEVEALSYISLSVNPGLVIKVDQNKKVTAVSYTNNEGNEMVKQIDFVNKSLEESVILFVDYCFENHYFDSNNNIDINVISDDSSQIKEIEAQINDIINEYLKTHSTALTISLDKVTSSQHTDAKNLGIPDSKVKLIDLILQYYPEFTKEQLAKESVDDLVEYLEDKGYDENFLDHLEDKLEDNNTDDEDDDDEDDKDEEDDDDD